jgi:hypothetical protein
MLLQLFLLFTCYQLLTQQSYFKQLLTLLVVLISICVYLSVLQLELFACFLFLAEFLVIIFFYTLLLHTKAAIGQITTKRADYYYTYQIGLSCFVLVLSYYALPGVIIIEPYLWVINVYKLLAAASLTDLLFF